MKTVLFWYFQQNQPIKNGRPNCKLYWRSLTEKSSFVACYISETEEKVLNVPFSSLALKPPILLTSWLWDSMLGQTSWKHSPIDDTGLSKQQVSNLVLLLEKKRGNKEGEQNRKSEKLEFACRSKAEQWRLQMIQFKEVSTLFWEMEWPSRFSQLKGTWCSRWIRYKALGNGNTVRTVDMGGKMHRCSETKKGRELREKFTNYGRWQKAENKCFVKGRVRDKMYPFLQFSKCNDENLKEGKLHVVQSKINWTEGTSLLFWKDNV